MRSFKVGLFLVASFISLSAQQAFSAATEVAVSGVVMAFDNQNVTLRQDGESIVIPRALLRGRKPKSGEALTVSMTPQQVMEIKAYKNKK